MMSRPRQTIAFLIGVISLGTEVAVAQIDVINHRQWAWLMQRRRQLLRVVEALPAARQVAVAKALTDCSEAVPLLTLARAMAVAKGVEADAPYRFRAGLQVLAMPEVVSKEGFKHLAVTIYAPHTGLTGDLPMPEVIKFALRVTDAKGKEIWRGGIDKVDDIRALREFRVVCKVPTAALPDGAYRVHVDTILDGQPARPRDLDLSTAFSVLDGYKARGGFFRLGAAAGGVVKVVEKLAPIPQAILRGAAEHASRAWFGMPGVDPAGSVVALQRAETILANLGADKPALNGLQGYVDIALPATGRDLVFVTPRLPPDGLPKPGSDAWVALAKRPLLLVIGRGPTWDLEARRPSHPPSALPGYLAAVLEAVRFDAAGRFQVVVVESPGRVATQGFAAMLDALGTLLPCDPRRLVLVGEGHGTAVAADLALRRPAAVAGLVLLGNSGGLATPQLRKLRKAEILALGYHGDSAGAQSIQLLNTYAANADHKTGLETDLQVALPWSIALPLSARRIEAFARRVTE